MGQTGCPHDGKVDGKVVSTTHPYLGALAGCLGCSLGRLHTRPGAPWERHDGALGSPLYPPAAVLRHKAMACGPSSSRGGHCWARAGFSCHTQAWRDAQGSRGEVRSFFLPTTSLGFSFWRQGLKASGWGWVRLKGAVGTCAS